MDNVVIEVMFPNWFSVLNGSRIDFTNIPVLTNTQSTLNIGQERNNRQGTCATANMCGIAEAPTTPNNGEGGDPPPPHPPLTTSGPSTPIRVPHMSKTSVMLQNIIESVTNEGKSASDTGTTSSSKSTRVWRRKNKESIILEYSI